MSLLKKPVVTYGLVGLNVIVFILMSLTGGSTNVENLLRFGASYQPLILAGQWYRLITPMFIHIGLEHLLLNMLTLYFCGIFLENIFGHWRFITLYFVAGIGGNLLSTSLGNNTISAGASTAIFGLFGTFIALGLVLRDSPYFKQLGRQFGILIVLNLGFALFPGAGIDIWGHLGGLISGFLFAGGVVNTKILGTSSNRRYQILSISCLILFMGGITWYLLNE